MSRVQISTRRQLGIAFAHEERDVRVIQWIVLFLLASLFCYAVWFVHKEDWTELFKLLPLTTAACAAVLVAKTATRLLTYNMLVREDDRAHDVVRCVHHAMAVIKDLRNRVRHISTTLVEGNRPLAALTQNIEVVQVRYESLYDRELYQFLPGHISDAIGDLSGAIFGLSAVVDGVASSLDNKSHQMVPPDKGDKRASMAKAAHRLSTQLDELFTHFEKLRDAHD